MASGLRETGAGGSSRARSSVTSHTPQSSHGGSPGRDDDADGNVVQPGGKGAVASELIEPFPCANEGLLCERGGFTAIADHAQAEGVYAPDILPVELLERRNVARLRGAHPWSLCTRRGRIGR